MAEHRPGDTARRGPDLLVPLVTWLVVVGLLAFVVLLAAVSPAAVPGDLGWRAVAVGLVAVTAQAAALRWRTVAPGPVVLLVCVVAPLAAVAGLGAATGATSVAVLVASCAVVVARPWPRPLPVLLAAAVLAGLGELVRAAREEGLSAGAWGGAALQGVSLVAVGAVVGLVVASRRQATRELAERVRAQAGEQAALAQAAVARQRTSMARELHDIAAHHLSGIAVVTAALDRQIDADPAGAKLAVRQVREQSTAMLQDLRRLVALLRDDDDHPARPEPETLGGLPGLVAQARAAGRPVTLDLRGVDADGLASLPVGPLAQLAAYRTVQEALANAARHAPGASCEVRVDARAGEVEVAVRNEPSLAPAASSPGGGFGILGMRERAELTGARLTTGPSPGGGWAVTLVLPTEPPPTDRTEEEP